MATTHTAFGHFLRHYRALRRAGLLNRVPVLLSEGDSWFSTQLYYNLVDWLEIEAPGAAFMRLESSGDLATDIFQGKQLRKLRSRLEDLDFDVLMISAGGNDFVDDFLAGLFRDQPAMSVDAAFQRVLDSGRFNDVKQAYERMISSAVAARPSIKILAHSYDYPRLMGKPARLTIENIGLIAFFKREVGDWIHTPMKTALDDADDQRDFAKRLMDHFHDDVLLKLTDHPSRAFHVSDFRGQLTSDEDWNDEMHPTGQGFKKLAKIYREDLKALLPVGKREAMG